MAGPLETTFRQLMQAEKANDGQAFDRIAEASGYDADSVVDAYVEWTKTGALAEPNPLKQVAQGAQLGFTDELVGFGSAVGKYIAGDKEFSKNYEARRDAERAASKVYQTTNPGRSVALNLAGGAFLPVPAGFVGKGATMAARAGRAAVLGVPYGAAAGAGMSESDTASGVALDAGIGGAIGAATGAVVTPATELVGKGVRAAGRAIANRGQVAIPAAPPAPQADALAPGVNLPQVGPDAPIGVGTSRSADEAIVQAMLKDGYTPEQVRMALAQRALDVDPRMTPMTVADILPQGGATQRLVRGARTNAPGAAGRADAMLTARDRLQGRRIEATGAQLIGSRMDDPDLATQEITRRAREAAGPLYRQVEQSGPADVSGLQAISGTEAFKRAQRAVAGMPDMQGLGLDDPRFLDQMYKELGGMRQALTDGMKKGGNVNPREITRLEMVMAPIRDALDNASGGTYSRALGAYSGEAQFKNALESGLEVMQKPAAAVAREINGLSPDQAQVYREAAMSAVRQRLRSMGYNRDAVKALFNSDEMVDKFAAILGKDKFKAFERAMLDEAKAVGTSQMVRGNSQTVDKAADALNAGGYLDMLTGAVADPQGTVTSGVLRAVVDRAGRMVPGAEARSDAILSRLLNPETDSTMLWLNQLIEAQKRLEQQRAIGIAVSAPALGSGFAVSGGAMQR